MSDGSGYDQAGDVYQMVDLLVKEHGITTSTISDVLDGLGIGDAVLTSQLSRLCGTGEPFHGSAYTVAWTAARKGAQIAAPSASTWSQVRDFLVPELDDGRGRVYVAGAGRLITEAALAGGMSATYFAEQLAFEGMVLGGAMRDRQLADRLDIAIVASNFTPADTQGAYRVNSVGTQCLVESVVVRTGDWIFSDLNGTVVVPLDRLDDVLERASNIETTERLILHRLAAGERLPDVVDSLGRI